MLDYKLVLMNKQEEVMVGLAHVPNRRYSSAIQIKTVGEQSGEGGRAGLQWVPGTQAAQAWKSTGLVACLQLQQSYCHAATAPLLAAVTQR